ncbi:MAG TPA: manganese efflux pump MntP family protein [Spirochaetia bacterium]|nr:manganese efflux pump MntP family protein [Spirochaetales bacterium]HPD80399.1 manganese efflux pump MntP family protein [Spirochaetales bacterium]HQK33193.1 manganese efflux pump MntP family protein [Spirochaetales bacterium]HRS65396.1 manganese efflux pump MntP family protein [Spirochaetia bacterium]
MLVYILAGISLSMDAFAIAVSSSICMPHMPLKLALRTSFMFGFFQFLMPVIGFFLGISTIQFIEKFDHWVAFLLLGFIGIKMIIESFGIKSEQACSDDEKKKTDIADFKTLLMLSIATSIDALAIGISYSIIYAPIWIAALLIGITTFIICVIGCEFGKRLGTKFEKSAVLVGGIVLIGIGTKILLEHLL